MIQEHFARRRHWDLRLEFGGVLKSWAVTSEPAATPGKRSLAVETEDHPLEYGKFHGTIPAGQYGAGRVLIWDRGRYTSDGSFEDALANGVITVRLKGRRLRGKFVLVRMKARGSGGGPHWLFFKAKPKVIGLRQKR